VDAEQFPADVIADLEHAVACNEPVEIRVSGDKRNGNHRQRDRHLMAGIGQTGVARTGEEHSRCIVRYPECEVQTLGSGMHAVTGEAEPRPPMGHVEAGFDLREVRSRIVQCLGCPAIVFPEGPTVFGDRSVRRLLQIR
jgi:hypothetical protein